MTLHDPTSEARRPEPSFSEFVAMIAATMALNAMAIDAMLPALPDIARSFALTNDNDVQWIIAIFVTGVGVGQLIYGPLSDWLGRRPVLLAGLSAFMLFTLVAAFATSLLALLALRAAQGITAAAGSVIPRSIVRDRYAGPIMAQVMSLTFIVFLTVPVVAPSVGQALLLVVPWRGIFGCLALLAALVSIWLALRLPETRRPEDRRVPDLTNILHAARFVLGHRSAIFYTLALTVLFGSMLAYVSTLPEIFAGEFDRPGLMPLTFALCAGTMGVASYLNARIVGRLGMRRISHVALMGFIVVNFVHVIAALNGSEGIPTFTVLQGLSMACAALITSNFGAISMQPMGAIAGSAASIQGTIVMIGGALVAATIGAQYSGSVLFLPIGALCCGVLALSFVFVAERGSLRDSHRQESIADVAKPCSRP